MTKIKRGLSICLAISLTLILTCSFISASARASDYLTQYAATLVAGTETGRFTIYYDVTATRRSDSLGVSQVKIYRSDGTYITTITGSTDNGLIREDSGTHTGTYRAYGVSGNYYYAVVTIFAERDGGSDSREITTNTIRVP